MGYVAGYIYLYKMFCNFYNGSSNQIASVLFYSFKLFSSNIEIQNYLQSNTNKVKKNQESKSSSHFNFSYDSIFYISYDNHFNI